MVESFEHIKYAKNVLSQRDFEELQEYIGDSVGDWPAYNFKPKDVPPRNKIEKAIVKLIGQDNHVEYWMRNIRKDQLTPWHVDANEIFLKNYCVEHGYKEDPPEAPKEFPLNTHILFVKVDPNLKGGELVLLPHNMYVPGRPVLDLGYKPLDMSRQLEIKPKENHLIFFNKPIYHAVNSNHSAAGFLHSYRISLMFSSWDYIPKPYDEWHHWSNAYGKQKAYQMKWPKGA